MFQDLNLFVLSLGRLSTAAGEANFGADVLMYNLVDNVWTKWVNDSLGRPYKTVYPTIHRSTWGQSRYTK